MARGVFMTEKELYRAEILAKVKDKRLSQSQAAQQLQITIRHLQRLYQSFLKEGAKGLISKKRGKRSNNKLPEEHSDMIKEIVSMKIYEGFRPTFMCEKLEELHEIKVSKETTRKLMTECGVWWPRKEKRPVIHQQRMRRARAGELLQVDGSLHAWFEDRGDKCCLIVFIDDATGRTYGKFFPTETTTAYMQTLLEYITLYGAPVAIYSDKHGIFRINQGHSTKKENFTQFGRVLHELEIQQIYAHSPQAKGRVERTNSTLQDRLIKEMRLAGISTIDEANSFLEGYLPIYNKRFCKAPASKENAHRKIRKKDDLNKIICKKEQRILSKNLEFQFENAIYQVEVREPSKKLIGAKITVSKHLNGAVVFTYEGKPLRVKKYEEQLGGEVELSLKELEALFSKRQSHKLGYNHPWLQQGRAEARMRAYKRM
jgi:transposase